MSASAERPGGHSQPDALSEALGGTGRIAVVHSESRGHDPGGQLAQWTEGGTSYDPGGKAVGQGSQQPRLVGDDRDGGHAKHAGGDNSG